MHPIALYAVNTAVNSIINIVIYGDVHGSESIAMEPCLINQKRDWSIIEYGQ